MNPHSAKLGAFGLERLGAHRRQERDEVGPIPVPGLSWPKGEPEEGERGVLVLRPAPTIFAIDDPRLVVDRLTR